MSNISWLPSASGRDAFISSSLQSFTGGPGQDVSCELNKGILAQCSLPGSQGFESWVVMYNLSL